ncbi:MAG: hypothetical protein K6E31_06375 [bacterium]|nr:hypothetical protein [bacterium]
MSFPKIIVSLRWFVLICLAALALSGCGLLPDIKAPPKVLSASNIQIKETDSGHMVVVSLQVMNPNDANLDIQSIRCGLVLNMNDKEFVLGAVTGAFTLNPNSSIEVPVKIPGLTADAASDLAHILWSCIMEGKPVTYALKGALVLNYLGLPAEVLLFCQGSMQDKTIHYDLESTLIVKLPYLPDPKIDVWSSSDDISINELIGSLPIQIKTTDGSAIDISLPITPPKGVRYDIQSISCGLALTVKDKIFAIRTATGAFTPKPDSSVEVPVQISSLTADKVGDLAYILWSCIVEGEPAIYSLQKGSLALNFHGSPVNVPFSSTGILRFRTKDKAIHYDLKGPLTVEWPFAITGEIPMGDGSAEE